MTNPVDSKLEVSCSNCIWMHLDIASFENAFEYLVANGGRNPIQRCGGIGSEHYKRVIIVDEQAKKCRSYKPKN
ncbi:MAG: hypothetical protein NTW17_00095 [Candidatus Pacearchaeota archaeon]|nr:hypothetical protein [Candidatus Pacearchaeota archaeon]